MKSLQQIGAELQGYDAAALRADKVLEFLAEMVQPLEETESLALKSAFRRILAEDIVSPLNVPAHDNSAMDGYAFRGEELGQTVEVRLRLVGTALAGKSWAGELALGDCVKIMTGAIMPAGLDTVIPQEFVKVDGAQVLFPARLVRTGDNRRLMGEDLRCGVPALRRGSRLDPASLGLVASLGIMQVKVFRRLRVAYFSTGDELLGLGEAPRVGALYDSNRYTVFGLLTGMGCEVIDLGVVRDDPALLEAAFRSAASAADAVITSGGVSVGEADFTKAMMKKLGHDDGGGVVFWRVAMRPGRPMAVGRIGDAAHQALLFGLPGNPVAVMVTFLAFVRPALLRMMGSSAGPAPLLKAHSLEAIAKKPGRTEYQRGIVSSAADGSLQVRTTGSQGSGVLRSMVEANGLIVLQHDLGDVSVGDEVDVMMFEGAM